MMCTECPFRCESNTLMQEHESKEHLKQNE